jgi:hypothetical protein
VDYPQLVGEVKFTEWTSEGEMRLPWAAQRQKGVRVAPEPLSPRCPLLVQSRTSNLLRANVRF